MAATNATDTFARLVVHALPPLYEVPALSILTSSIEGLGRAGTVLLKHMEIRVGCVGWPSTQVCLPTCDTQHMQKDRHV